MYLVTSDSRQIFWCVVVLTFSSAKLYAEDELKIRQKSMTYRENTLFS